MPWASLLSQGGVVDGDKTGDGRADEDTLVSSVDGVVQAVDRELTQEPAEGDALGVDNVGQDGLGNAERQGVDAGLVDGAGTGAGTGVAGGAQVEEVAKGAGDQDAGEQPGEDRGPEARGEQEEHVWQVDGVVRGSNGANGGDGEGIAVGKDLGADVVQFKGRDDEEDAGNGAESLAGGLGGLVDAAVLVDGADALSDGQGRAVESGSNIGGSSRKRDAGSDLGQAAGGSANDRAGSSTINPRQVY